MNKVLIKAKENLIEIKKDLMHSVLLFLLSLAPLSIILKETFSWPPGLSFLLYMFYGLLSLKFLLEIKDFHSFSSTIKKLEEVDHIS